MREKNRDEQSEKSWLQRRWLALKVWQRVLAVALGVVVVLVVISGLGYLKLGAGA